MNEHSSLTKVSQAFSVWRQTRTKKGKIPDHLIEQILQLKEVPRSRIAKTLGINSSTLKAILEYPQKIDFISLPTMPHHVASKIACTLSRTDGTQLKLELSEHQISDFMRTFLCSK